MTLRVLIVDDNADHRFLTRRALRTLAPHLAIQIETAEGGTQALARLHATPTPPDIDLVLLDLKMPDMDGIEVLHALRHDERTRTLPVLLFSSTEQDSDRQRALSAGADAIITKPIAAERFQTCIRDTILDWAKQAGHTTSA